ncbi:hypothetical protein GF318_05720 [Candidatus Micrarchaeota archaeon]|nr:hypothetical protein [Candidatus Micrarchaeota archaeon]
MTSHKIAAIMLILVALSAAFDLGQCFYSYEEDVAVTYTNFTLQGNQYSIVYFDGTETFLFENGEPLTDSEKIRSIISIHYLNEYYPSSDEIEDARELLDEYNQSRNDGQKFPGKEEYVCREVIFIDGRVKNGNQPIYCRTEADEERCQDASMLMYQFLTSVTGTPPVSSPSVLLEPIEDFGFASYGTDYLLGNITQKLDEAEDNRSQMYSALEYAEESIPTLEEYMEDMEDSLFTWNENLACDSNHWCLCPDININETKLEELEEQVGDLKDKLGPYDEYQEVSENICNASQERLEYMETETRAQEYLSDYEEFNGSAAELIPVAEEATDHISNFTVSQNLSRLKTLHAKIPEDISNREFNTTESDIEEYGRLIDELEDASSLMLTEYNETKQAKNDVGSLMVLLETKDLDPVSLEKLDLLRNKTEDLDAEFRDGMTLEELNNLEEEYRSVEGEARELLSVESETPAKKVLLLFRGFARNVNTGIAGVAEKTEIIEPEEIPENSTVTLGLFSALVFLSLASIALLVFLYIIATTKFSVPKTSHVLASAFLSVMILLLGFSAFMYMFLGKTSTDATLPEFLADFSEKNSTTIMVDLRNASYSDAVAMTTCAGSLAESFDEQNKSWTIYKLTANTCTEVTPAANTSLSVDQCLGNASESESEFVLEYSDTNEPPRFSVIYENKAEIRANYDYYDSCPLVALFS